MEINFERWEGDEYIVTINNRRVGKTLSKGYSRVVAEWLASATNDLRYLLQEET